MWGKELECSFINSLRYWLTSRWESWVIRKAGALSITITALGSNKKFSFPRTWHRNRPALCWLGFQQCDLRPTTAAAAAVGFGCSYFTVFCLCDRDYTMKEKMHKVKLISKVQIIAQLYCKIIIRSFNLIKTSFNYLICNCFSLRVLVIFLISVKCVEICLVSRTCKKCSCNY